MPCTETNILTRFLCATIFEKSLPLFCFAEGNMYCVTAQLVTSGVKGLNQQGLRATSPSGVTLSQGGQSFQLITPVQRPRVQQANLQQNVTARGILTLYFMTVVMVCTYMDYYYEIQTL